MLILLAVEQLNLPIRLKMSTQCLPDVLFICRRQCNLVSRTPYIHANEKLPFLTVRCVTHAAAVMLHSVRHRKTSFRATRTAALGFN